MVPYDFSTIGWVAAAATAGVAVGYNYARRKFDNARRSPRATRSPSILPLRHNPSTRPSLPLATPPEVKEEEPREESTETDSSQETAADVTEPGTLKRKSREFDVEISTKVSVGVNTDEPPRKKSRTPSPPTEARPRPTEQNMQEAEAFLQDFFTNELPAISRETKPIVHEAIAEADVSMSDEVYEPFGQPATLLTTARRDSAPEPPSPLAAPIIRSRPLPTLATPPPVLPTDFRSSPSPSASESAPRESSTVLPAFASGGFGAYSMMTGSAFSVSAKPAFAAPPSTTTSSTSFTGFGSTSETASFSEAAARISTKSTFGWSSKATTTPRAYVFAEAKPATSFGSFASTSRSFASVPRGELFKSSRDAAPDDDMAEEVDELYEETEPAGDGALAAVPTLAEETPMNTGEEGEQVLEELFGVSLRIYRDGQWATSSIPVNMKWLRDSEDGKERIVCRQNTGAVRMNVALGTLPTSAKIEFPPAAQYALKQVRSLLITAPETETDASGAVKVKVVKYLLKVGGTTIENFRLFLENLERSVKLLSRMEEGGEASEVEVEDEEAEVAAPPVAVEVS